MPNDDTGDPSTRRAALEYGGAVVVGGHLGGCSGTDAAGVPTATAETDGSYSVRLSPAGDVAFDRVPETVSTVCPQYVDVATGGDGR